MYNFSVLTIGLKFIPSHSHPPHPPTTPYGALAPCPLEAWALQTHARGLGFMGNPANIWHRISYTKSGIFSGNGLYNLS